MPKHKLHKLPLLERLSIQITDWMGTPESIIVHTLLFMASFALILIGVSSSTVMLIVTTAVSLEAIYLALFIQMTVNRHSQSLKEVEEDIDEIQEDVEEIEDIRENLEELQDADSEEGLLDQQHELKTIQTLETIEQQMATLAHNFDTIKNEINSLKSSYNSHQA